MHCLEFQVLGITKRRKPLILLGFQRFLSSDIFDYFALMSDFSKSLENRLGSRPRGFESHSLRQQKTHFCLPTKVRFLNDVCLRQMMTASPNDVRCANDVCLAAHWANIASLRNEVEQHHFCKANTSYRRRRCII